MTSGGLSLLSLRLFDIPERLRDLARRLDVEDYFLIVVANTGVSQSSEGRLQARIHKSL